MADGGEDITPEECLPSAISHTPFALGMRTTRRDLLSRLGFGLTFLPALAMAPRSVVGSLLFEPDGVLVPAKPRSEEHTSELQSRLHLVCRLLLEKKK